MSNSDKNSGQGAVVEEEIYLTLVELSRACCTSEKRVIKWVFEGVLEPIGEVPQDWRFTGQALRRARLALSLSRDLAVNPPGIALALDLLDQIAGLQARLQRTGVRWQVKS
jgi:chaperone modulatory protein CbpM